MNQIPKTNEPQIRGAEWWTGMVGKPVRVMLVQRPREWHAWEVQAMNGTAITLTNHWDEYDRKSQVVVDPSLVYAEEVRMG
jgi:hypothetical protein